MDNPNDLAAQEPETWIEPIARFIWNVTIDHGIKIVLFFSIYSLCSVVFKKLYLQGLVTLWKQYLDYIGTLATMKDLLASDDYELELWSEPEFCKKYLDLYEKFRYFRSIANRDHKGNSLIDDRWRQEEAKPLYQFFNFDYELHDRLIYALDGTESTGEYEAKAIMIEEFDGENKKVEEFNGENKR